MPEYIEPPIETDVQGLIQLAYAFMQANIVGWIPRTSEPDYWLLMSAIFALAELRNTASRVPTSVYRYLGSRLLRVQTIDATQAYTTVKFTAIDNQGYTIDAETNVGIPDASGTPVAFSTINAAVIPPGSTVISGVEVLAVLAGADATDLGGVNTPGMLIDTLSFIDSVTVEAATQGGTDAETDDDYNDRLSGELELLSPTPILPDDFAVMSLKVDGNYRATGIAGYNPLDGTYNNERMVTVALMDINGDPRDTTAKAATVDYLETLREINFVAHAIDATYTNINFVYTAKAAAGFDPDEVKVNCDIALSAYVDPAIWGTLPRRPRAWATERIVRYNEAMHRLSNVPGVDYVLSLALGTTSSPAQGVDAQLTGVAPLPRIGTISGSVVP